MSVGITVLLHFYTISLSFEMSCDETTKDQLWVKIFDFNIGEWEGAFSLSSTVSNN